MSLFESLVVTIFSMSLVFLVLAILCATVKALSLLCSMKAPDNSSEKSTVGSSGNSGTDLNGDTEDASVGELKLVNVDEKTAAIIMAIVSDESGIPVSELCFKSITAID